jgi:TolA-binding protein
MRPYHVWIPCALILLAAEALPAVAASTAGVDAKKGGGSTAGARSAPAARVQAPTAEERAVLDIQQVSMRQINQLMDQCKALTDQAKIAELQRQMSQIKFDTRIEILRSRAQFARQRGDEAAARDVEQFIAQLLKPAPTTAVGQGRAVLDKSAPVKGGQQ